MGRNRNAKAERRAAGRPGPGRLRRNGLVPVHPNPRTSTIQCIELNESPRSVFRFLKRKDHAEQFMDGEIYLTTLEECRRYEESGRGDPGEATQTYFSGHVVGGSNDPALVEIAARSGITIGPGCPNVTISNSQRVTRLPDALVLCTTGIFDPDNMAETFGEWCIEIIDPRSFRLELTKALARAEPVRQAVMGTVQYRPREYTGLEPAPGPIGFVKPPDVYSPQQEFRFLWLLAKDDYSPVKVVAPELRKFLRWKAIS